MDLPVSTVHILIVENDPIFAIKLEIMLAELNYTHIQTANNVYDAFLLASREPPTLVISDIYLEGRQTGIDLRNKLIPLKIPFILMTQYEEDFLYKEAKQDFFTPYLIKPFHKLTLQSTIDFILHNHFEVSSPRSLFVRVNQNKLVRVNYDDILWIHTELNYSYIYTITTKYVLKKSMIALLSDLDDRFVRVHNSYAINSNHIKSISAKYLLVGDAQNVIPVSRTFKSELAKYIM